MEYLNLEKIDAYVVAYRLGNEIWEIVAGWDKFEKWTLGMQVVRSADSISANIAEGFGRYHKKDKIKFYRYSYGSMKETIDWLQKAKDRKLLSDDKADHLFSKINTLPKHIHQLIRFTNQKLKY